MSELKQVENAFHYSKGLVDVLVKQLVKERDRYRAALEEINNIYHSEKRTWNQVRVVLRGLVTRDKASDE